MSYVIAARLVQLHDSNIFTESVRKMETLQMFYISDTWRNACTQREAYQSWFFIFSALKANCLEGEYGRIITVTPLYNLVSLLRRNVPSFTDTPVLRRQRRSAHTNCGLIQNFLLPSSLSAQAHMVQAMI